ncbi:MAG: lytic transglycosylase domain-containing protein [Dehalococcoidia bacterium]
MTTRLPDEPVRVTSWLAGWVDYVFATVLVAGRWLRLPLSQPDSEPGFRTAFAPAMNDHFGPRWHDEEPSQKSGPLVKAAEIIMMSVSFFLAAHLLSGGTSTAVAPNLNRLLGERSQEAQTQLVAGLPRAEITVPATAYAQVIPAQTDAAPAITEQAAALQPPSSENAAAAAVQQAAPPAAEPTQAPRVETAPPPPAPAAVAPPAPEPTLAPEPVGRYMTSSEIRAAVVAAGWPSALVEDVVNVAWCESRFHSGAQYGGALGLMQMMPFWFTAAGLEPSQWSDPVTNMRAALFAYQEHERNHADPWGPWTCKPDHGLDQPE